MSDFLKYVRLATFCLLLGVGVAARAQTPNLNETPEKLAFFESKVRPLLLAHCVACHGDAKQKGGLRLDSKSAWQKGGELGPAILPFKPDDSLLIKAVRYQDEEIKMPPKKALAPEDVDILVQWVRQGAIDPRTESPRSVVPVPEPKWETEFQKRLDWWSLKPLRTDEPSKNVTGSWSSDPIDRYIKAGLEAKHLQPASPATAEILLRRVSFVLTGLPPTPELQERYLREVKTDETAAYERLIDALLASPQFGERFARHWMDVVRYTDTYGYEWDNPAKGAYEYRDYLIRVFNGDLPYDQFVREQLAGDLLVPPRINNELAINESLIAPMFYHMGEHRHGSSLAFNGVHQEMVNNKIEVFSKAFLATTVACSRCHDHKLEAVSQRDYYALGAIFMTPRWTSRVVDAPGKNDGQIQQLLALRTAIQKEIAKIWQRESEKPNGWSLMSLRAIVPEKPAVKPAIEDVVHPLARLAYAKSDEVLSTWTSLSHEWKKTRADRLKQNQGFKVLADFASPTFPKGWVTEGDGIKFGFVDEATPLITLDGPRVFARLLPRGYHTHALSSKLPGAVRMPSDDVVPGKSVSVKLAGGEYGGYLEIHENAFQGEEVTFLKNDIPMWRTITDKHHIHGITRITYDFTTASLNSNFPPRTGLAAGLPNNDFGYDKRSWISLTGIVSHDGATPPQDTLDVFTDLYESTPPKSATEVDQRVTKWFAQAVQRWAKGESRAGDQALLDWMIEKKLLPNTSATGSEVARLLAEYRRIEQGIAFPRTVNSMDERETAKASYALNVRGNVDVIGVMVPPEFLSMFAGRNDVARSAGSGRLEMANALVQPEHPLTSRVYVNRLWHWTMGTGIVATPDDFGRLGEKPTHPELLDFLAQEFVRSGWSTKKMVKRLLLTQTFKQSGMVTKGARTADPLNRLRHHYPTRRLEAEAIRDSILAISGRLDRTLYGRPIFPPRVAEDGAKRLFAGPLDGNGRRSIYLQMSIMEPPRFLVGFNLPDLRLPTGRRDATNVPAQALILLNDPFVNAMASHWGRALTKLPHSSPDERVRAMFGVAYARLPTDLELRNWTAAAQEFRSEAQADLMKEENVWTQLAHAIFNTKEFIYYR